MPTLQEEAARAGLQTQYHDAFGHEVQVEDETLRLILDALRVDLPPTGLTPPCHIVTQGEEIALHLANTIGCAWRLTLEDGNHFDGGIAAGTDTLTLPADLPLGYHRLHVEQGGTTTETTIIVAPPRAYQPWERDSAQKVWGLSAQLYGLRSGRNWGIGDFSDLAQLVKGAARLGAAFVGINPLHALFPDEPENASPYSPSSRQYLNWLYLDIEAIPEFLESLDARILVESHEFQHELARLRSQPLVDYAGVAIAKRKVLELIYATFRERHLERNDARDRTFTAYRRAQGVSLRHFALFHALREHLGANDWTMRDWANWPADYANPDAPGIQAFLAEQGERVEYYEYIQFLLDEQLAAVGRAVKSAALGIGLYGDLAVGVERSGAEAWANQSVVISALSIGCPPDPLAPHGQNWGLPLLSPAMLQQRHYEPFIRVIRAAMSRYGALRIDHVLGLMRLYCIPNARPTGGTYLQYPFEDLVRLLALESHRQQCLIIGEDLGTLPEGFRHRIGSYGILSYRVLWFERTETAYIAPESYPAQALITGGTHDLPTMLGFWDNEDVKLRRDLGLVKDSEMAAFLAERAREKEGVTTLLHEAGLLPENVTPAQVPLLEIHRLMARTPCHLMTVQLDDALQQRNQANLPGTTTEHPNWRRKMPVDLQALFTDQTMRNLATVLAEEHRADGKFIAPPPSTVNPRLAIPGSTYRLQFSADFTFDDATAIIPYLSDLGITHVYASSYLAARAGSTHGYDIIDHNALNPEIGNEDSFARYLAALDAWRMGQILDFVPNHMGVGKSDNQWWLDVLEWGQESPFARYFDIDWQASDAARRGKLLVPVLGGPFGDTVQHGGIKLIFEAAMGSFNLWYGEHRFPIRPVDYPAILQRAERPELAELIAAFAKLAKTRDFGQRRSTAGSLKAELVQLALRDPEMGKILQAAADSFNGTADSRTSWRDFVALIERQHYRLASWRIAADEINYRRFFDINDLAGIRMEDPELFELTHRMIGRLVAQGALQGIRLDHIDGLYDPLDYLIRLYKYLGRFGAPADPRARGRDRFYILVEKILSLDESLPQPWPVAGTTGYDFITELNGVFVNRAAETAFDRIYRDFTGETETFDEIVETAKHLVIGTLLPSDLNRLTRRLKTIADRDWNTRDFSQNRLRQALIEVVTGFQVYRTYITARTTSAEDRRRIGQAVAQAKARWGWQDTEIFDFIEKALTGDLAREPGSTYRKAEVFAFIQAFQQYTGPVMAKSLEDTSFYRYYRLASLNEVGSDPRMFGLTREQFHAAAEKRRSCSPHSMLGSSTHDTKRGEDTRARINVLSEVPDEWAALLQELKAIAAPFKTEGMPSANDEYLIYQTMLGIWSERQGEEEHLLERLQQYLTKALREAKVHSSWVAANEPYEKATLDFAAALYANREFMDKLRPFARKVVKFGYLNGLSQTVLKLTAPGVSDIFQGSDLWNHSLADPDNRSKVDYELRRQMLADRPQLQEMLATFTTPDELEDGAIKLRLLQRLLRLRRGLPELFENGSYQSVEIKGTHATSLLAFTRRFGSKELLVVVGRLLVGVEAAGTAPGVYAWDWQDTVLDIPAHHWRDMLGANHIDGREGFAAGGLFGALPVGVWVNEL